MRDDRGIFPRTFTSAIFVSFLGGPAPSGGRAWLVSQYSSTMICARSSRASMS